MLNKVEEQMHKCFLSEIGPVLRGINKKILSSAPNEDLLDYVFENVGKIIPFDRIGIALLSGDRLQSHWIRSKLPIHYLKKGYSARIEGSSLQSILASGRPRIIGDLERYLTDHPDSNSTRLIVSDGIRSSLTCPLYDEGRPAGVIFFSSAQPNTYKEEHVEVFEDLADELALVVQKGKLQAGFDENRAKDQMLSTVLHDLKSPLGVMHGFLQLLKEEDWFSELEPSAQEMFEILSRNCNQMLKLVDDLKEAGSFTRRGHKVCPELVDLRDFLSGVGSDAGMLAGLKNITFEVKLEFKAPVRVRFDPRRIKQVLENLISNAIKFSQPGTRVMLSVSTEGGELLFTVADQGSGIPLEEIPRLFREFGKTSVRPTAGEESTGLGLFIARKLVEGHGGKISVTSEPGKGSLFKIRLPV